MKFNYSILLDAEGHLSKAAEQRRGQMEKLRNFFTYQEEQVTTLLQLVLMYKSSHPLGLGLADLCRLLEQHKRMHLFLDVGATINTLGSLSLLEIRPNGTVDVTPLGYDYVLESYRK